MPKELKAKQKSSRSAIEGGQGERRVPLGAFFFPYTFFLAKQKESILAAGAAKYPGGKTAALRPVIGRQPASSATVPNQLHGEHMESGGTSVEPFYFREHAKKKGYSLPVQRNPP